jgi:antitoxin component HigA of HigAB toxin-antitoxin module
MDLDKLKADYEKADDKASKLTGEYEQKRQEGLDRLRERYADRIDKATQEAADAQKAYMDALVVQDLLDRPDGVTLGRTLVGQGGLAKEAFEAEFGSA